MYGSLVIILIALQLFLCRRIHSFHLPVSSSTSRSSRSPLVNKPWSAIMNTDLGQQHNETARSKRMKSDASLSSSFNDPPPAAVVESKPRIGTLYITIGPQCSGKTTILKRIFGKSFHKNEERESDATGLASGIDITIDDQALVYIPVPIRYFIHDSDASDTTTGGVEGKNDISPSMMVLGKTIRERIHDSSNDELRWVIQRLGGLITSEQFASLLRVSGYGADHSLINSSEDVEHNPVHIDLVAAVENMMSSKVAYERLPKEVDLFVVESIFRSRPLELIRDIARDVSSVFSLIESSALDAALEQLKSHATDNNIHSRTAPLAWGNTNTRPREYKSALEAASLSGRPVEFIVFGGMETCNMIREHLSRREYRMSHDVDSAIADSTQINESTDADHFSKNADQYHMRCLPKLSRRELLKRNLNRFATTGKYIPSGAIQDAIVRVESMLASAAAEAKKNVDHTSKLSLEEAKFRLDYELAMLAGYMLHPDRTVVLAPTQNVNDKTDGRAGRIDLNRDSRQNVGGINGRRQAEGRRSDNHTYQGRNSYEDRRNGGRQSNYQQNHYRQIRQDGNYQQGQVWNRFLSHGQDQPRERNESEYYSNCHAPNRWGHIGQSGVNPYVQSHDVRYNDQQGHQYHSYSTNLYRHTNSRNEFYNSHNENNGHGQENYNYRNP